MTARSAAAATAAASRPSPAPPRSADPLGVQRAARVLELFRARRPRRVPRRRGGGRGGRRARVAAVVNVLNPELVVIGGELAGAGPVLLDPLRRAIERSR